MLCVGHDELLLDSMKGACREGERLQLDVPALGAMGFGWCPQGPD